MRLSSIILHWNFRFVCYLHHEWKMWTLSNKRIIINYNCSPNACNLIMKWSHLTFTIHTCWQSNELWNSCSFVLIFQLSELITILAVMLQRDKQLTRQQYPMNCPHLIIFLNFPKREMHHFLHCIIWTIGKLQHSYMHVDSINNGFFFSFLFFFEIGISYSKRVAFVSVINLPLLNISSSHFCPAFI